MNKPSSIFNQHHFLTDGGLETTLIFHLGVSLNHFAAFELLQTEAGQKALEAYYLPYLDLANKYNLGFVLESPSWRANTDWGFALGYTSDTLAVLNKQSINFIRDLAQPYVQQLPQLVISGNVGPRGDGYNAVKQMTARQARDYHLPQVEAFASTGADVVTALTLNYSDEAIGIIEAARLCTMPVVISFTAETDGTLPNGESLRAAIERTDKATDHYAEHFMINCAHPQHFIEKLYVNATWKNRIRGIRANASTKSHAELDESTELDSGDKCLLAEEYSQLFRLLPELRVIGGCCGTDHSHLEEICKALEQNYSAV